MFYFIAFFIDIVYCNNNSIILNLDINTYKLLIGPIGKFAEIKDIDLTNKTDYTNKNLLLDINYLNNNEYKRNFMTKFLKNYTIPKNYKNPYVSFTEKNCKVVFTVNSGRLLDRNIVNFIYWIGFPEYNKIKLKLYYIMFGYLTEKNLTGIEKKFMRDYTNNIISLSGTCNIASMFNSEEHRNIAENFMSIHTDYFQRSNFYPVNYNVFLFYITYNNFVIFTTMYICDF